MPALQSLPAAIALPFVAIVVATVGGAEVRAQDAARAASPSPLPADWAQRDLEGKWFAYHEARGASLDRQVPARWARALGAAGELELLERIVLYEGWQYAGPVLVELDAPQWVRCAVWSLGGFGPYSREEARKALMKDRARTAGWLEAFPSARVGAAEDLYRRLVDAGLAPERDARDLPPHDAMQVLVPDLDAPKRLVRFGARLRASPGERYVHQVVRALHAVIVHGVRDGAVVTKMVQLTAHDDPVVRQTAFETLTGLPGELVPFAPLAAIVDDEAADALCRQWAVGALACSSHPGALDVLVRLALEPAHPGHEQAIAQLRKQADPVVVDAFRQANVVSAELERALDEITALADKRHSQGIYLQPLHLQRMLARVAWLRVTKAPNAYDVARATRRSLRDSPGDLLASVNAVVALPSHRLPFDPSIRAEVEAQLRSYATSLLVK